MMLLACLGLLFSCAGPVPTATSGQALDRHLEQATIEEYILSMPESYTGEKSPVAFKTRVLAARAQPQNIDRDADSLYVPSDGDAPAKSFHVNRKRHSLSVEIINRESAKPSKRYERLRYQGQWWEVGSPVTPW
jgi:hypothetical protein